MRPLQRILDLAALAHNRRELQRRAGARRLLAVVKANAYGHGVEALRPVLDEVPLLAVAAIDEALQLRALGYRQPVLLLEGFFHRDEAPLAAAENFWPCLHNEEQWALIPAGTALTVWLKLDSGMHRLGFDGPGYERARQLLAQRPEWRLRGLLSHFHRADEADLGPSRAQRDGLKRFVPPAGVERSFSNSAALLALEDVEEEWVRPGLALYGLSPFAASVGADFNLRPVMTLRTEVIATHRLEAGDRAGYGGQFEAPTAGTLATIALGYGDGFKREIVPGRVRLRLNGRLYPLVGRVAMDMSLLWLGDDSARPGDEVIVFGADNPAETLAAALDTIPYTLSTTLTARVATVLRPAED